MRTASKILLRASLVVSACFISAPLTVSAQSTTQKVENSVSTGAKTLKHNVVKTSRRLAHKTKRAAHKTSIATSNLIHGHRILCGDGTWASRDNPSCHDHDGVAARQPQDRDDH
ncbi:MAG TPA: hypothetical protein VNC11_14845 [Gemmatimonadaceae bacterium]|jgi:hypothetical protein|nr:hypothetical protein [Gemmatimonadaceae bacterium]